jgi:hypothetical protein
LSFSLNIGRSGRAYDVKKTGAPDLGLDHLCGKSYPGEQPGKLPSRRREPPLLLEKMLLNSDNHRIVPLTAAMEEAEIADACVGIRI